MFSAVVRKIGIAQPHFVEVEQYQRFREHAHEVKFAQVAGLPNTRNSSTCGYEGPRERGQSPVWTKFVRGTIFPKGVD